MATRAEIKDLLDVQNEALSEKYLGMLTHVGVMNNKAFKYPKDRVRKRVQGMDGTMPLSRWQRGPD
jgi:hypothetical protein